jgi:hypothetical protein
MPWVRLPEPGALHVQAQVHKPRVRVEAGPVTAILAALWWTLPVLLALALSRLTPDLRDAGQPDEDGEW